MTVMQVTCVRHGRTSWNAEGRWQGHADVGLDNFGRMQAARVAAWLNTQPPPIDAVISSDLLRARWTADPIALGAGVPLQFDRRLREIDMGDWQGMTGPEVELWDSARLAAVRNGGLAVQRPGGESLQQVADRVLALFNELADDPARGAHVVLVSHGGTIRMLLHALNLLETTHDHIHNTSCTTIVRDNSSMPGNASSAWRVAAFATLTHLDGLTEIDDQPA